MAVYENKSGGRLVLPDDTDILVGASADVSDVKNAAVAEWIKAGWLVPVRVDPVSKSNKNK